MHHYLVSSNIHIYNSNTQVRTTKNPSWLDLKLYYILYVFFFLMYRTFFFFPLLSLLYTRGLYVLCMSVWVFHLKGFLSSFNKLLERNMKNKESKKLDQKGNIKSSVLLNPEPERMPSSLLLPLSHLWTLTAVTKAALEARRDTAQHGTFDWEADPNRMQSHPQHCELTDQLTCTVAGTRWG